MTDRKNFNLDLRPETYWDCPETLVANIKGYVRKRSIVTAIKKGKVDSLPAEAFADSATEDDKEALAERGLAFLGGEDLPDPQRPQCHRRPGPRTVPSHVRMLQPVLRIKAPELVEDGH